MLYHSRSVLLVEMYQHLDITIRHEFMSPPCEHRAKLSVVKYLSVTHQCERAIFISKWLVTALDVDNTQSLKP
jgi:hypothetical protein